MEEVKTWTVCDALKEKYNDETLDDCFSEVKISNKAALQQLQNHEQKRILILDSCRINSCGGVGDLSKVCPLLQELDLSSNEISEWEQVFNIVNGLEHLTFLNLSHNPLCNSQVKSNVDILSKNLKKLAVNNIKLEFGGLIEILKVFPSITQLHASLNNFGELNKTDVSFHNVTSLHFVNNNISSWEDIIQLGYIFPSLKTLVIAENPIEKIPATLVKCFPCLEKLSLNDTLISSWESLDQLREFPLLTDVRFARIPLWKNHSDEKLRRQLLIARLPKTKLINGGKIDETEIEDAERAFIRFYSKQLNQPKRYEELLKVHGHLPELVDIDLSGEGENILVKLTGDIEEETELEVTTNLTVKQLRKMIAKQYKLSLSEFRLFYRDRSEGCFQTELFLNSQTLKRYFTGDGDEIYLQRYSVPNNCK